MTLPPAPAQAPGTRSPTVALVGVAAARIGVRRRLEAEGFAVHEFEPTGAPCTAGADVALLVASDAEQLTAARRWVDQPGPLLRAPRLVRAPARLGRAELPRVPETWLGWHLSSPAWARTLRETLTSTAALRRAEDDRARLEVLLEVARTAAAAPDLDSLLHVVVEKLGRRLGAERCAVLLLPASGDPVVAATLEAADAPPMRVELGKYPELALALERRETVVIADVSRDVRVAAVRPLLERLGVRSILVQPITAGGEVLGALFLRRTSEVAALEAEDIALAEGVAAALGEPLRHARRMQELKAKRDELEGAYLDRYRELAATNRRLHDANRLKDELLATCSHDLRSPLGVLLGHTQLLLDQLPDEAPQRRSLEVVQRQGHRILELVEGLLERGRGEEAKLALEAAELDLAQLCVDATRDLEILARERGLTLRVEAPMELWALADRSKLQQVLHNLIQNALGHARSRIDVHAELLRGEPPRARLSVVDDGEGVPEGQRARIFERWHHGPGGVGLGLSICREWVELHGGEIWVEGGPHGGAAFRFVLPIAADKQSRPGERPRVLLVEDEADIAREAIAVLRDRFRVEWARDGAEAIAKARALRPDVVLLDLLMPRVDGLDTVAALRQAPDTSEIPVVMAGNAPDLDARLRGLHLGLAGVLPKPYRPEALVESLERAIRRPVAREGLARIGLDPRSGLLERKVFLERFRQEQSRARRYRRALSCLVATPRSSGVPAPSPGLWREQLRDIDVAGQVGPGEVAVVLPETPVEEARALARGLAALLPDHEVRAGAVPLDLSPELTLESVRVQADEGKPT